MSNELHMDSVLAVQRTIASLQTTYSEPLSIEQLAQQAQPVGAIVRKLVRKTAFSFIHKTAASFYTLI